MILKKCFQKPGAWGPTSLSYALCPTIVQLLTLGDKSPDAIWLEAWSSGEKPQAAQEE